MWGPCGDGDVAGAMKGHGKVPVRDGMHHVPMGTLPECVGTRWGLCGDKAGALWGGGQP